MSTTAIPVPASRPIWLLLLCASRFATSLSFMVYAGALGPAMQAWGMSAGEAGSIQTAFNVGYALSLVGSSWFADSLGAKHVFQWASWATALTGLAFALFARSAESGLLLFALMGLTQGGTYAPSIMLVAQGVPAARRGTAVGWLLAAGSLGYFASIALAAGLSERFGYEAAFIACGLGPLLAALLATPGLRRRPNLVAGGPSRRLRGAFHFLADRRSVLLTAGYTTHCWELLGMWAWLPAFLTTSLSGTGEAGSGGAGLRGLWIAGAIHLSGFLSSLLMGRASDRLGRRAVLVAMGLLGAACSVSIGWLDGMPLPMVLAVAALYGFAALGDSPVLSTAMTESVEPGSLGAALAVRSILGFGAGGAAPLAVGLVLDHAGGAAGSGWGWGFALLGVGGGLAAVCALLLPADRPHRS
ncbi:major facilitator family transporter (plasmid) [Azospirillum sp. B510]|uniref:MFS transporter n=1 Tax=Azospirillum sp. (strain B510) TaxID=137722 RepID=UPI0001C4B9A5|nr:MFS transporter [Azospirillum sp. B510]BAI73746.1 major facilitator family transporter [Azospirillum sp. B510]